ncbi:MAG TPA: hypothetical protein DCS93_31765 [Microscillaceae bacterium]|nr:hypothetical protein [Microscillaceae bacterium]
MISEQQQNHHILEEELTWLRQVVSNRIEDPTSKVLFEETPFIMIPELGGNTHYEMVVNRLKLGKNDRVLLLLALARALDDESLYDLKDILSPQASIEGGESANRNATTWVKRLAGGYLHQETRTFIPTLKTLLFLLHGNHKIGYQQALLHFHSNHPLFAEGIVEVHPLGVTPQSGQAVQDWINHQVFLNPAYLHYLLGGALPSKEEEMVEKSAKELVATPKDEKLPRQTEDEKQKVARKAQLEEEAAKAFEEPAQPSKPKQVPKPPTPQPIANKQPVSPGQGAYNADNQYVPPPAPPQYELDGDRVILSMELSMNGWLRFLPQGFVYARQELPKNLGKFYALTEHEIKVTLQMAANLAEEEGTNRIKFSPHVNDPLEILKKKLGKVSLYRDQFSGM